MLYGVRSQFLICNRSIFSWRVLFCVRSKWKRFTHRYYNGTLPLKWIGKRLGNGHIRKFRRGRNYLHQIGGADDGSENHVDRVPWNFNAHIRRATVECAVRFLSKGQRVSCIVTLNATISSCEKLNATFNVLRRFSCPTHLPSYSMW